MNRVLLIFILMGYAVIANAQQPAKGRPQGFGLRKQIFVVKLLSPLSTKTAKQGDTFTASVESPSQYQGGIMEGRITKLKRPKKGVGQGKAEVQFAFESLTFNSRSARIAADLGEVANSQGVKNVDEEGQVVGKTSNGKRIGAMIAGAAGGAIIGGLSGGGRGAIIGTIAGGAAGLAIGLKMTTTGSDIEFKPGSLFTLTVSDAAQSNGS